MEKELFISFAQHEVSVKAFAKALLASPGRVRLQKKTSNLFRTRHPSSSALDANAFSHTLMVCPEKGYAEVQGMCTFEDFTDACLEHGCIPAVVPELKTITVGGAVSGVGIEASSFRHGLVHECVDEMEILCADGEVRLCRSDNEYSDLFHAIPNSYGTLGYVLRLRFKVIPASPTVHVEYRRYTSRADFLKEMDQACREDTPHDFVEGVAFSPAFYTLVTAKRSQEKADTCLPGKEPYYLNLRRRDHAVLSMRDWIWRWDADWFWCSRFYGMENPLLRRLFGGFMLRSARYWKLLDFYRRHHLDRWANRLRQLRGESPVLREPMVQDVEIPLERCNDFLDFYDSVLDVRPLWICPVRPQAKASSYTLYDMHPGQLHLNFGFWQSVESKPHLPEGHFNRLLEETVDHLGGRKSLYSDSFYPMEEFRRIYGGDAYDSLRRRYDPGHRFPDLYHKTVLRR